jgi:hypothetical protein
VVARWPGGQAGQWWAIYRFLSQRLNNEGRCGASSVIDHAAVKQSNAIKDLPHCLNLSIMVISQTNETVHSQATLISPRPPNNINYEF